MATRGVNKVILVGTLGKNPEIRMTQNGQSVANINIATSETWQDKATGETKEKTEWHRVVLYGKLAEIAGKYLQKGSKVYIEGQLQTRKWQDQNGIERYVTEVVVNPFGGIMQMLGGGQQDSYQQQTQPQNHQQQNNYQQNQPHYVDMPDEDIPF